MSEFKLLIFFVYLTLNSFNVVEVIFHAVLFILSERFKFQTQSFACLFF